MPSIVQISASAASFIETYAEAAQFVIPISAGAYALYKGDYRQAAQLALSALIQKAEIVCLKTLVPRTRPNLHDFKSFPSGHTAGAFLGVGLLASRYGCNPLTVTALASSVLVGLSRYMTGHHHFSDVVAGAAIGLFNGLLAGYAPTS